jgi:serine/threonine protein kinase
MMRQKGSDLSAPPTQESATMRPKARENLAQNVPPPRRIGNDMYVFEQRVGSHGERYRAHIEGKKGRSFLVHIFPSDSVSRNRIHVLQSLARDDRDLPRIEEFSVQGKSTYVVLRWVPGRPLLEYLLEGKENPQSPFRMSVVEALRLFNGFVHLLRRLNGNRNIIHGDLKPENLTIALEPSRLLMIDFGSAWLVERTMRRDPGDGIDFDYAAPELQQSFNSEGGGRRLALDFRSDQFSASVIFYEMLTFERPFGGAGAKAWHPDYRESCELEPPSKTSPGRTLLSPRVWKAIDHAVLTGLNFDPDSRFQNFNLWIDALKAIQRESERAKELSKPSKAAVWLADLLGKFGKRKRGKR